jgi:hypothetical protein
MFWFALLCFLVAAGGLLGLFFAEDRFLAGCVLAVAGVLGGVALISSMISFVPTRNVGIVTAYGKATGRTTGAGMQWTKPWEGIDDWDATRQSYNHLGDKCEKPGDGSLWVLIAGQRNMCVRVQVNWETTTQKRATENWATYRDRDDMNRFEVFTHSQVIPGINSALLSVFKDFDPLSLIDPATGEAKAPDLDGQFTGKLKTAINATLGDDIKVMGVAWGLPGYDGPTTNLISQYGQKILEKRNLKVDSDNAGTRSTIARNTGVPAAVQQCLDLVKALGKGEPGLCLSGSGVTLTRPVG